MRAGGCAWATLGALPTGLQVTTAAAGSSRTLRSTTLTARAAACEWGGCWRQCSVRGWLRVSGTVDRTRGSI